MKHLNVIKIFFVLGLVGSVVSANAQIHPLAFSTSTNVNWYANYVGLRFQVTAPAGIAGDKQYTTAYSGTTPWGGQVTTPLVNMPIIMDTTSDSFGCSSFSIDMTNHIAVIWRGPITSACEFGLKALNAQNAHAKAVVLINEYPGMGPIGMAAGASGGSVSIPVFMISNQDGIAISGQYRSGVPVTMTITPWGLGYRNDIGFVPAGAAGWNSYAVPYDQLTPGTSPAPYKGLDGAFIANYGSSDAVNVRLAANLTFNPRTGSPYTVHSDTAVGEAVFTGLAHSPASDSIIAYFTTPEYNVAPTTTSPGRYDLKYTILSDTTDQYPLDNSLTLSFYASDSVYSKGKYDFTNKVPVSTLWEGLNGTTDYVWGNMYYVAHSGSAVRTLQFSLYNSANTLGSITSAPMDLFVFKWVDGSGGQPKDSVVQNGELHLLSQGTYAFAGSDTSGMAFTLPYMSDSDGNQGKAPMWLDSNSWYYVCAVVSNGYFLGCDGSSAVSGYPRVYGRAHSTGYLEYTDMLWAGDYKTAEGSGPYMTDSVASGYLPLAFAGSAYIDSFNFANQKGLIPSIPMIVTKTPDTSHAHDAVPGVLKPATKVDLFPNPADGYMDVSLVMDKPAHTVTYTVIDGLARFVSKETHHNIQNETYRMATDKLPVGNYFLVINMDDKMVTKKFTVIR